MQYLDLLLFWDDLFFLVLGLPDPKASLGRGTATSGRTPYHTLIHHMHFIRYTTMAWAHSNLNQLVQITTDLAWLLVWVSKDHVQGTLMVSVQVTKLCCSE